MITRVAPALIALACFLSSASHAALTEQQMREDLIFLRDEWAPKNQSFDTSAKRRFDAVLRSGIGRTNQMTEADFRLTIAEAVASGKNAHNGAAVLDDAVFPPLPIRIWWFSDGLYVVRARGDGLPLLGSRITHLDGQPVEAVFQSVRKLIAGTDVWARYRSIAWLIRPNVLRHVGVPTSGSAITVRYVLPAGQVGEAALAADATVGPVGDRPLWAQALVPGGADGDWRHVLDGKQLPLSLRPEVDVSSEWLDPSSLYVRINNVFSSDNKSFEWKLWPIVEEAASRRPKLAIVDLRFNHGGDIKLALPFVQGLPRLLDDQGRLVVLSGRSTMSAAIVMQALLKGVDPGKVTVVGEPVGDEARFWSEGRPLSLPNSKIEVVYNDGLWDLQRGCRGQVHCYWVGATYVPPVGSLKPDRLVRWSFADYSRGVDPVLEAARALATRARQ